MWHPTPTLDPSQHDRAFRARHIPVGPLAQNAVLSVWQSGPADDPLFEVTLLNYPRQSRVMFEDNLGTFREPVRRVRGRQALLDLMDRVHQEICAQG